MKCDGFLEIVPKMPAALGVQSALYSSPRIWMIQRFLGENMGQKKQRPVSHGQHSASGSTILPPIA